MDFFKDLLNEITGFFSIRPIIDVVNSGDYNELLTFDGVLQLLSPVIPLVLLIEINGAVLYKRFKIDDYKIPRLRL